MVSAYLLKDWDWNGQTHTHTVQATCTLFRKKSRFSLEFGIRGSKTASKSLHLDCDAKGDEILRKFYARGRC